MKYLAILLVLAISPKLPAQCPNGQCPNCPRQVFTVVKSADPVNSAVVIVHVPEILASDVLNVNGVPTATTGTIRTYVTPTLTPGNSYTYDVEIKGLVNGPWSWGHTVTVKAGYTTEVFSLTDSSQDKTYVTGSGPAPGPVTEFKPHLCTCGCISTGKCTCPNCAVGCGLLPADKKK